MASKETTVNKSDEFFQLVSSGSVDELKKILVYYVPEEISAIVNSVNSEGETPLLVASKEGHYDMVKFLVKTLKADINRFGRLTLKGLDYAEVPPLFAATMSYRKHGRLCFQLTDVEFDDTNKSNALLNSISSSTLLTRNQKIEILELLGAAYSMKYGNRDLIFLGHHKIAYFFWLESLRLRSAEHPYIPKVQQHLSEATRKVFGNASEFKTEEELENIFTTLQNDTELINPAVFYLVTQALLMTHRIMSELQLDPHPFFLYNLLQFGINWFGPLPNELVRMNRNYFTMSSRAQYGRIADVLICVTESLRALPSVFRCEWSWDIFEKLLRRTNMEKRHIPFSIVMEILRQFSDFHSRWLDCNITQRSYNSAMRDVVGLVVKIHDSLLNEMETVEFKQWLSQYILMMNGHSGVYSPLHCICEYNLINTFNRIPVIKLLLEAGANPMATDQRGFSPLFYSLYHRHLFRDKNGNSHHLTAVQLLLDFGAHLDQPTAWKTPLEMFKEMQLNLEKEGRPDPYIDSICNRVFPLQCLCAQVIGHHGIPFNDFPVVLRTFIQNHKISKIN